MNDERALASVVAQMKTPKQRLEPRSVGHSWVAPDQTRLVSARPRRRRPRRRDSGRSAPPRELPCTGRAISTRPLFPRRCQLASVLGPAIFVKRSYRILNDLAPPGRRQEQLRWRSGIACGPPVPSRVATIPVHLRRPRRYLRRRLRSLRSRSISECTVMTGEGAM